MTDLEAAILTLAAHPHLCREARALVMCAYGTQAGGTSLADAVRLLQEPGLPKLNLPSDDGRCMGEHLARMTGPVEGQCDSCGYKLGTIPNQSLTTVETALACTMSGEPFLCHQDGKPCRAWVHTQQVLHQKP